jgi:hypothetical protein
MAWIDTGTKRIFTAGNGVSITDVAGITVSVGDFVLFGVNALGAGKPQPTLVASDSLSNTWDNSTCAVSYDGGTNGVASTFRWTTVAFPGTMTVTISGNGSNSYDLGGFLHVFQNPNATPVSGTAVSANDGGVASTPMDSTAFTAADSDALYASVATCASSRTITQNNAAGDTDWTLSNEQQSASFVAGSMVYKIQTGAATSRRSAWTLDSAALWATTILAFKPAVSAGVTVTKLNIGRFRANAFTHGRK